MFHWNWFYVKLLFNPNMGTIVDSSDYPQDLYNVTESCEVQNHGRSNTLYRIQKTFESSSIHQDQLLSAESVATPGLCNNTSIGSLNNLKLKTLENCQLEHETWDISSTGGQIFTLAQQFCNSPPVYNSCASWFLHNANNLFKCCKFLTRLLHDFQLLHEPWKYKLLQTSGKSKLLPLQLENATGNAWRLSQHNHLK